MTRLVRRKSSGATAEDILRDIGDVLDYEDFWTARPELETIRAMARSRMASPWSTLGIVLAREITAVHPRLVLPPIVGGQVSLNLYVGITATSGVGKDTGFEAAEAALPVHVRTARPGSGEGIAHQYVRREGGDVIQHNNSVLFQMREVKTLGGLKDRSASTLLPELCTAWMGHELGHAYVDEKKRLPMEKHAYRLCLAVGIQDANAGILLDDADSGTPQRFLWLPSTDPDAPMVTPDDPEPLKWDPQAWAPEFAAAPGQEYCMGSPELVEMKVCDAVRDAVRADRLAVLHEKPSLPPHALLSREKVAAALALLAERTEITDGDWELAGYVMDVSDRNRHAISAAATEAQRQRNRARGRDEGERQVIVRQQVEASDLSQAKNRVLSLIASEPEGITQSGLNRAVSRKDRDNLGQAVTELAAEKRIEIIRSEYHGQKRTTYALAPDG